MVKIKSSLRKMSSRRSLHCAVGCFQVKITLEYFELFSGHQSAGTDYSKVASSNTSHLEAHAARLNLNHQQTGLVFLLNKAL